MSRPSRARRAFDQPVKAYRLDKLLLPIGITFGDFFLRLGAGCTICADDAAAGHPTGWLPLAVVAPRPPAMGVDHNRDASPLVHALRWGLMACRPARKKTANFGAENHLGPTNLLLYRRCRISMN